MFWLGVFVGSLLGGSVGVLTVCILTAPKMERLIIAAGLDR